MIVRATQRNPKEVEPNTIQFMYIFWLKRGKESFNKQKIIVWTANQLTNNSNETNANVGKWVAAKIKMTNETNKYIAKRQANRMKTKLHQ